MNTLLAVTAVGFALGLGPATAADEPTDILNVSYDVSRELFADVNKAFIAKYKAETGKDHHRQPVACRLVEAGARRCSKGWTADVVTFNQVTDVADPADQGGLVARRLAGASSPTRPRPSIRCRPSWCARAIRRTSRTGTISSRDDVKVVFPNPKTSGNARYTYLAAYAYALEKFRRRPGQGAGLREEALRQCAGVRHRRPRGHHDLRRARASATC